MRTESVELTVLCLIHKNGRYLLQDRIKNDWKGYTSGRSYRAGGIHRGCGDKSCGETEKNNL